MSVGRKKITYKVYFLLILMFSFICTQFVNDFIRIHELAAYKTEQCEDISFEDSGSQEAKMFGAEETADCLTRHPIKPLIREFIINTNTFSFSPNIHEVYLGLNTPPPEQINLLA